MSRKFDSGVVLSQSLKPYELQPLKVLLQIPHEVRIILSVGSLYTLVTNLSNIDSPSRASPQPSLDCFQPSLDCFGVQLVALWECSLDCWSWSLSPFPAQSELSSGAPPSSSCGQSLTRCEVCLAQLFLTVCSHSLIIFYLFLRVAVHEVKTIGAQSVP